MDISACVYTALVILRHVQTMTSTESIVDAQMYRIALDVIVLMILIPAWCL
jgi:hypothetical protein